MAHYCARASETCDCGVVYPLSGYDYGISRPFKIEIKWMEKLEGGRGSEPGHTGQTLPPTPFTLPTLKSTGD